MTWPGRSAAHPHGRASLLHHVATDGDFVLRVSSAGRLLGASDSVADVLGWDVERCAAEGLCAEISDEAQRVVARQFLAQVLAQGRARSTVQLSAGNQRLWLDVAGKHLVGEPGAPIHISARDVSHDLELAARLAASERQWRVAFEHPRSEGRCWTPSAASWSPMRHCHGWWVGHCISSLA